MKALLNLSTLLALCISILGNTLSVTPAHAAGICYVKWNAAGVNNGTSWTDAYTDLQSTLGASTCTEIWVAGGTYKPSTPAGRAATFQLKSGVALYGGFAGTETLRNERAYMTNVSILSGDIGATGVNTDNVYHVVTGSGTISTALLDGFTITAGNANAAALPNDRGGGLYSDTGSPTLINITISGNNSGSGGGGGARFTASTAALTNVTFSDNTSSGSGGGLLVQGISAGVVLTNTTFTNNSTSTGANGGGGYFSGGTSSATLNNVTFSGNSAPNGDGGAIGMNAASLTIKNSIFWGNMSSVGSQIRTFVIPPTSLNVNDSIVQGGCPANATCTNVSSADPQLGPIGNYGGFNQTFWLAGTSPAINGTSSSCPSTDQRNQPRSSPTCDLGAYELNLVPYAVSIAGSALTGSTAVLEGIVNANSGANTTVTFEYGLDTSYGSTVTAAQSPVAFVLDHFVTALISGLSPVTTYHFRVIAQNPNGIYTGSDQTFTTLKGDQSISFTTTAPGSAVVGGATYTPSPTGGASGNPIVLTIDAAAASVCSIAGGVVTFLTAGTCIINANQAGSANYNAAAQVQQSFTVGKGTQAALTVVATPSTVPYGSTSALSITGGNGTGAVTYSAGTSTGCSITGSTLSVTDASGTCNISATRAADNNYNAATSAEVAVTLTTTDQGSTDRCGNSFNGPLWQHFGIVHPGGNGTGAVTYSAGTSTGCSITGSTLSVTDASGTCNISATRAADNNYNAATSAEVAVTLTTTDQAALTVVATPSTVPYGSTSALSITGGSGTGAVTYSAGTSTGCSVTGSTLSVTDASGTCSVSATRAADNNYNAATSAEIAVTLTTTDQAALTVVATPSTVAYGSTSALSITGGNGTGAVTYSAGTSTGCSITGSTLSVTDASGTCNISATRAADNNYNAATSAEVAVTLTTTDQAALTVVATPSTVPYGSTSALSITGGNGTGAVTYSAGTSTGCSVTGSTLSVTDASGTCSVSATRAADNNYNAATSAEIAVTLVKTDQAALTVVATPSTVAYGNTSALSIPDRRGNPFNGPLWQHFGIVHHRWQRNWCCHIQRRNFDWLFRHRQHTLRHGCFGDMQCQRNQSRG
ncbi:choice-of-anchor Q domain-containing protein [Candidatus Villigracilis saccharophilus]|uniref:beta strand repeat-containing protein n=1 Tax=Candidatus Villigracilis saccharophilus TaxID=3140684 RepID=UPI003135384B|nr:hypothetical protein [Anaerolineales bacterium]